MLRFASQKRKKKHAEVPCSRGSLSLLSEACLVGLRVALQFHGDTKTTPGNGWVGLMNVPVFLFYLLVSRCFLHLVDLIRLVVVVVVWSVVGLLTFE